MATSERPKARQSQLVTTYGIGSLFPAGDQSFMICGIDEWDEKWSPTVEEPRLARSLGVHSFRAPATGKRSGDVPVVRFPVYHYCPGCRRLDRFWKFDAKKMQCPDCVRDIAPSRFVACCENGHIEDFPYFQWVHRGTAAAGGEHRMKLEAKGASSSLADVVVSCSCGVKPYNLDGSFSRGALAEIKRCGGKRPWLPAAPDEQCDKQLRALQRGSSNVWFGAVRSSISIPPWSSPNSRFVTTHWGVLEHLPMEALSAALPQMITGKPGLTVDGVTDVLRQRKGLDTGTPPSDKDLREEEYRALIDGNDGGAHDSFQCVRVEHDPRLSGLVAQVSKATRLREVRALEGFSRVTPMPTDTTDPRLARLSENRPAWLPATEVLGEGIFVRLDEDAVTRWETGAFAKEREALLDEALRRRATESGAPVAEGPSARFLAIHSLAHALLQELSLDAGYPVGSLRERIYAEPGQAGLLVYTASSDAAGSLGGLAALADAELFADIVMAATGRAQWCSHDPVCAESGSSGSDGLNMAACHACLLLPETSCEHRNIYLDRLSIVGPLEHLGSGIVGALGGMTGDAGDGAWNGSLANATVAEAALAGEIARRLPDVPVPTLGDEVLDGIPLSLAWPDRKVAVTTPEMSEHTVRELESAGWTMVTPDVERIGAALGAT
ncbi:DrmB family protein [Isoptericola sp. b515]|uniref:DrmB family protein n=1 Tax=Isoptericola sp. b515 TaxID=3064652 RepID=UPI002712816F|nr:DrmB family protein [Isoptericola sp. b515]MDO8147492.1 DrmB family protein [Isoptericola sp. b515]